MTSSGRIHAVATFSIDEANTWIVGVKTPLTSYQEDALYAAVGTTWGSNEMDKAAIILGFWKINNAEALGASYVDEVRPAVLEKHQVVKLDKKNWPRYPVLAFSYST